MAGAGRRNDAATTVIKTRRFKGRPQLVTGLHRQLAEASPLWRAQVPPSRRRFDASRGPGLRIHSLVLFPYIRTHVQNDLGETPIRLNTPKQIVEQSILRSRSSQPRGCHRARSTVGGPDRRCQSFADLGPIAELMRLAPLPEQRSSSSCHRQHGGCAP